MRRDDHLVGAERAQAVLDRLEGIRVADLALGRDAELAQPLQAPLEPLAPPPSAVLVRREIAHRRHQRRADDANELLDALRAAVNHIAKRRPADGLVRDHEDAALARRARADHGPLRRLAPGLDDHSDRQERQQHEDGDAEPGVDRGRDDDQGEVADREQDETECIGLVPERVPHGPSLPLPEAGTAGGAHRSTRGRSSCTPRSTLRPRSASRSRGSRHRGDATR